jgi:Cu/Ag efflux protein CusF
MKNNKRWFALLLMVVTLFIPLTGYTAGQESHRTLNTEVTDIKGDMIFYKTEEGTTRNVSRQVVEKFEKVENVKVGDKLVMEFDEGNQVIRINRADRSKVSGQIVKFDPTEKKVTLKLKDGTTQTYTVIPPVASKMAGLPEGTNVALDIDEKNNFVKDFERLG